MYLPFFPNVNQDEHVSTKVSTSTFYKGSGVNSSTETKESYKKKNGMETFPLRWFFLKFIFYVLTGLPKFPKL